MKQEVYLNFKQKTHTGLMGMWPTSAIKDTNKWLKKREGVIHLKVKSESNAYCSGISSKKKFDQTGTHTHHFKF